MSSVILGNYKHVSSWWKTLLCVKIPQICNHNYPLSYAFCLTSFLLEFPLALSALCVVFIHLFITAHLPFGIQQADVQFLCQAVQVKIYFVQMYTYSDILLSQYKFQEFYFKAFPQQGKTSSILWPQKIRANLFQSLPKDGWGGDME